MVKILVLVIMKLYPHLFIVWGMLSALCDDVDTFHLAPLDPGIYSYKHTMTSGFGMPDCTPGVVPDDVDSISFEVISLSGDDLVNNKISINDYPKGLYFMKITYGNR